MPHQSEKTTPSNPDLFRISASPPSETLFTNAAFLTVDPAAPRAEALLVRDGRIQALGRAADLRALAPDAAVIDLAGRVAIPGFVDAHNHFSLTALAPVEVDCLTPPVSSIDDLLARVHEAVAGLPPGRWLRGHGYDDALLGGHPTRDALDEVAPQNPVVLVHWTVHRCVANSAALRVAGIPDDAPDPPGGWIVRAADAGRGDACVAPVAPVAPMTGLLYERASDPLQAASLAAYAAAFDADLPALFHDAAALQMREGITALGDAYVHPALAPVYARAALPLTVRPYCGSPAGLFAPPDACVQTHPTADPVGSLLPAGIKIFTDGGGNTTSASLASGRPPRFLFYSQDGLNDLVARAHAAALPIAVHAAGDIGVTMALDAFAHARRAHSDIAPRFRIEHAITLKRSDIPRLRDLGVTIVTQPEAVYGSGTRLTQAALAPGVLVAPFRALLDAGVALAFSSDSPCYALPPLWQTWCAVTRATAEGVPLADGQAVTVAEALAAYTRAGARAIAAEGDLGILAPGARADIAVLSADPRRASSDELRRLRVERLFLAGVEQDLAVAPDTPPPGRPVPPS